MRTIPVVISSCDQLDVGLDEFRQELDFYQLLGYSYVELAMEKFHRFSDEQILFELKKRKMNLAAIKLSIDFAQKSKIPNEMAKLKKIMPKLVLFKECPLLVLSDKRSLCDEEKSEGNRSAAHNQTVLDIQRFSKFFFELYGTQTIIQPSKRGPFYDKKNMEELLSKGNDSLAICLDTGYFASRDHDPLDLIKEWADHIGYIYLKDVDHARKECLVGEGIIDHGVLFDAMEECRYQGKVCIGSGRKVKKLAKHFADTFQTIDYLESLSVT